VVAYAHRTVSGCNDSLTDDEKTKAPTRRLFYCLANSQNEEKPMTMLRGTRMITGQQAAALRTLEGRFRSWLHRSGC